MVSYIIEVHYTKEVCHEYKSGIFETVQKAGR